MSCIVVLGVHRSGTSCVAGILHHLGVPMGVRLLGPHPANPKGHFEDEEFLELHQKILDERDPEGRPIAARWRYPDFDFESHRPAYQALVDERSRRSLWGLKDPRLCHLMPSFLSCYKGPLKAVWVFRPAEDSARSLHARERADEPGFTLSEAREILRDHRQALRCAAVQAATRGPLLMLGYDWIVEHRECAVAELARFVQIDNIQPALDFVDPALRHHHGG